MTDDDKMKIRGAFFRWVIKDPYPEHSFWQSLPKWARMMAAKPEPISIHKAWRDGYEFAKSLVMKELS